MKSFSRRDLSQLFDISNDRLVSIYFPTLTGVDSRQNPVRLKNLARAAEEELVKQGAKPVDARRALAPVNDLLDPPMLGQELGRGMAVFVGRGEVRAMRLPFACEELWRVGQHFHIVPPLAWLRSDAPYYVLAVSQNQVRFLRGTRGEIEPIEVPELPANRDEAVRFDDAEPGLSAHSARPYLGRIKESMAFHGHGGAPDANKDLIAEFFRQIDRALAPALRLETEPLVFAGVDYLFPMYRETNSYPHLLPTPVSGNPELWSNDEIRQRAWPLVEAMVRERRQAEIGKYGNLIPQGRALSRLDEILLAAHAGAVETLFVDPAARRTGAFDPSEPRVEIDDRPRDDREDLVNLAAMLTLRSRGVVEPLDSREVPGDGVAAATLRYPFPRPAES